MKTASQDLFLWHLGHCAKFGLTCLLFKIDSGHPLYFDWGDFAAFLWHQLGYFGVESGKGLGRVVI